MGDTVYVLDSHMLTLSLGGDAKIARRILATPSSDLWLPAIVVQEQFRGRLLFLSSLNPARVPDCSKIPQAYGLLLETVRDRQKIQYLSHTAEMEDLFQSWPATRATSSRSPASAQRTGAFSSVQDWSV